MLEDEFKLCFRGLVKYPDCNATKNLFGGQLLAWLDEYVAIEAKRITKHDKIVTKKFSEMVFKTPTPLGSILSIYAKPIALGKTSITMKAIAVKNFDHKEEIIAESDIVYVAVDKDNKPVIWNN